MKNHLLLFAFATFFATGCASIVSKSRYPINITSVPNKTSFVITNRKGQEVISGVTPTVVTLKSGSGFFRKAIYNIKFTKEGYETKTVTLSSDVNGWYFGNIIFGGFIGLLIVDPATGAMYRISETEVQGVLNQVTSHLDNEESRSLRIMSVDEVPAEIRKHMIRID